MQLNNYEITHKDGDYVVKEHVVSKEGKAYQANQKTYPNSKVCCKELVKCSEVFEEVEKVCDEVYKEYRQVVSQAFIKAKEKSNENKTKKEKQNEI